MGYKKLDEVMELLTDELDGFNRSIDRLERLAQNVDGIKIEPNTSEIENIIRKHLDSEKAKTSWFRESVQDIVVQLSSAQQVPKAQLWIQYLIWLISLAIIGYLTIKISRVDNLREQAFLEGEQSVISSLRGYFDQHPEQYVTYQKWVKQKDSIPDQK